MIPGSLNTMMMGEVAAVGAWTPANEFSGGQQGGWYDFSDPSTMFQDAAGTTPVTATGQSVRRINDKSGRGNSLTAPSDSARPILQNDGNYYLNFDGSDDSLSTSSIDFTSTTSLTICAGIATSSTGGYPIVVEVSTEWDSTNGGAVICAVGSSANNIFIGDKLAAGAGYRLINITYTMPSPRVMTSQFTNSTGVLAARINAVVASTNSGSGPTTGNFGNNAIFVGSRNNTNLRLTGKIYQLVVCGAAISDLTNLESYIAEKSGVTL